MDLQMDINLDFRQPDIQGVHRNADKSKLKFKVEIIIRN